MDVIRHYHEIFNCEFQLFDVMAEDVDEETWVAIGLEEVLAGRGFRGDEEGARGAQDVMGVGVS